MLERQSELLKTISETFSTLRESFSAKDAQEILILRYPADESLIKETIANMTTTDEQTQMQQVNKAVKSKMKKEKPERVEKAPSKLQQARELLKTLPPLSTRKQVIELFAHGLGMSPAMASTYYYNLLKE